VTVVDSATSLHVSAFTSESAMFSTYSHFILLQFVQNVGALQRDCPAGRQEVFVLDSVSLQL
jgi:hypothetical protein